MCVLGWNRIVPNKILSEIRIGAIGSHSSPGILPFGRGRSPVVWTIKLGFNQIYTHLFKMTDEVDSGEILAIKGIVIDHNDDVDYIYKKISFCQTILIDIAIENLKKKQSINVESDNIDLLLPKRSKNDAIINWNNSSSDIHNLIRAVSPTYHGAFFKFENKEYEINISKVWDIEFKGEYKVGEVISKLGNVILIKCGSGILAIIKHNIPLNIFNIGDVFS